MNFNEVTLIEIEDYIQALDEKVGLKIETIQDIAQAISKQRGLVKKLTIPVVINLVCPFCGGSPVEKVSGENYCPYCDKYW